MAINNTNFQFTTMPTPANRTVFRQRNVRRPGAYETTIDAQKTATNPGVLGSLPSGLGNDVQTGISDQVSGNALRPAKLASREALATAAQNLRSQQGALNAPNVGQGSAVRAQQGVEQNIMTELSQNELNMAQQEQEMKDLGLKNALGLARDESRLGFDYNKLNTDTKLAYDEMDVDTKKFFAGLDSVEQQFFAGLDSDEQRYFAGLDQEDRQFYSTLSSTERRWAQEYGLDRAQFDAVYGEGGFEDRRTKITESTEASRAYWDGSERFMTYAQTHLNEDLNDQGMMNELRSWYKTKYGKDPNTNSAEFANFMGWAKSELAAARDGRLNNPIDAFIYQVNSSNIPQAAKDVLIASQTDPAMLMEALGITRGPNGQIILDNPESVNAANNAFLVEQGEEPFDATRTNTSDRYGKFENGYMVVEDLGSVSDGDKVRLLFNQPVEDSFGEKSTVPPGDYEIRIESTWNGPVKETYMYAVDKKGKKYHIADPDPDRVFGIIPLR